MIEFAKVGRSCWSSCSGSCSTAGKTAAASRPAPDTPSPRGPPRPASLQRQRDRICSGRRELDTTHATQTTDREALSGAAGGGAVRRGAGARGGGPGAQRGQWARRPRLRPRPAPRRAPPRPGRRPRSAHISYNVRVTFGDKLQLNGNSNTKSSK